VETSEWKELVAKLRNEWKALWRERINDKVRAEGIANRDYSKLFVDRGLVIVATKDYKPLDFVEILQQHTSLNVNERAIPPNPFVGGWRKFIRDFISKQKRFTKRGRPIPSEAKCKRKQQLKKGGRGWLHFKMRE
jgi:hypothetical protein